MKYITNAVVAICLTLFGVGAVQAQNFSASAPTTLRSATELTTGAVASTTETLPLSRNNSAIHVFLDYTSGDNDVTTVTPFVQTQVGGALYSIPSHVTVLTTTSNTTARIPLYDLPGVSYGFYAQGGAVSGSLKISTKIERK